MKKSIFEKVSNKLNISPKLVQDIYNLYWSYIKETIQSLPLKEDLTKESFNNLRTNFNIPSIGKLYCNYERYLGVKDKINHIK